MKIYFDGTLIDSDNYISFSNEFKQFDETFLLGTTASNTITIEVPSTIAIPTNVLIKINETNYASLIVDSYEYEDNNILKLNLVDKMVLLDFNYNAQSIVPCTVKQILQNICLQAGITLATNSFTNDSLVVDYYDNTLTAREYVGMIAELNGGFARINTSGELELVKFSGTPTDIDIETCEDFRIGEKHKIERVVFDSGILKFESSTDESLETLYLNNQNVYITNETVFNNIASEILNFEFYCFSTGNCEIKPTVKAGDLINFTDGENNYPTIAQYDVSFMGGLSGGYELNINSKKQEETKVIGVGESFKRLRIEVNRDLNQITETIEGQIDGIEKEINPTQIASGSSIYLEDSAEVELIDFELEGETEQATSSSPVMPSPDNPSELKNVGYQNLLKLGTGTTSRNNTELSVNNNIINFKNTGTTNYVAYGIDNELRNTNYGNYVGWKNMTLKAGTYTLNYKYISGSTTTTNAGGNFLRLIVYSRPIGDTGRLETNLGNIPISTTSSYITFTITEDKEINLVVYLYGSNATIDMTFKTWITNTSEESEYIPYGKYGIEIKTTNSNNNSNIYLYILDEPLRGIGDYKDKLYIKNGYLYTERKLGKILLNGTETGWNYQNSCFTINIDGIKETPAYADRDQKLVMSNYFAWQLSAYRGSLQDLHITKAIDSGNPKQIAFKYSTYTSTNDFKTWLSTHNTEVQYVLAESIIEELGEVNIPSTYKDVTYIDSIDELEPNMTINYVRDTLIANYVESHVADIKLTEKGIESRVQSIEESDYGSRINAVEERTTDTEKSIEVISTNIDTTTGEVRKVTTTNGMTFDENGLNIHTNQSTFNAQHTYEGTYYRDGEEVITETTISGFKATNLKNKGQHEYSYDDTNELYEFIDERIEVDGEYCYATFYNGEE